MALSLNIPGTLGTAVLVPGWPGAAGGPGGPEFPNQGTGWEVFVRKAPDYKTLLAKIPERLFTNLTFSHLLNDIGSGSISLNQDDPWWNNVLGDGSPGHFLLDEEHLWQVTQNGILRFEFLGETVTEQLVDPSEQRIATITGPNTIATLKWAAAMPPGFPNITYKLDAITDSFSETDTNGNLVVDYTLWNASGPTSHISLNPSGSVQLMASPGGTILGTTPYNATTTLISAEVTPISPLSTTGVLNGSQLTQFYIQDLGNSNNYALIGLSAGALYAQYRGPEGTFTKTIATTAAYVNAMNANSTYQYWQISEAKGTFFFWTSPDGQNWTKQASWKHSWNALQVGFYMSAQYSVDSTYFATFTAVNSNVTVSTLGGAYYLNQPIMATWLQLLNAAKARGTIPFLTTLFNAKHDSFNRPWADDISVQISNGTDLYTLLQGHTAMIAADYRMDPGFTLTVGIPQTTGQITLGTDRSHQVIFREKADETTKQRVRVRDSIANLIAVINTDGRTVTADNTSSVASWGQREGWVQAAEQVNLSDLVIVADASSEATGSETLQWTMQIVPNEKWHTVFRDFQVGDWVGLERPDFSAVDTVRVIGITVSVDQQGLETHELVLSSYLTWLEQRLQYIATKMGGGFISAAGTTPVSSNGDVSNIVQPTVYNFTLNGLGIGGGSGGGTPMVYNPVTGQWQPAGSATNTGVTISGSNGQVAIDPQGGSVTVSNPGVSTAPLNANSTFAGGSTTGWTATNATLTTTSSPPAGCPTTYAAVLTPTSSSPFLVASSLAVSAGTAYVLGPYVYLATQSDMRISMKIAWYNAAGSNFQTDNVPVTVQAGIWTQAVYQDTAPAAATSAIFSFGPWTGVNTNPLYVANAEFTAAIPDGSTPPPSGQTTTTPQGVTVIDSTGQVRIAATTQSDGTITVVESGAPPPGTPDTPSLGGIVNGVVAGWDGLLNGNAPLSDFLWTEVHLSTSSGFTPSSATLQSTMSAGGIASITGLTPGTTYYCKLVARNRSRVASQPSSQASTAALSVAGGIGPGSISASQVNFTARQIGGITTSIQSTAPTGALQGDLWYDSSNNYKLNQYNGTAWVAYQFGTNAIAAGSITAALIAANTITAAQIAAGTITAAQIATATITATQIASGTITATQIAAGTLTANLFQAGIVLAKIVDGTVITGSTLQNSNADPRTSINPDGSVSITNSSAVKVFTVGPDGTLSWYTGTGALMMQVQPGGTTLIYASATGPTGWNFEPPGGPPTQIGGTSSTSSSLTYTVGLSATSPEDDTVIVIASSSGADDASGVTDTQGNTYTRVATNTASEHVQVFAATNNTGLGLSDSLTVSYGSANTNNKNFLAFTISDLGALDISHASNGTSTTASTSASSTYGGEFCLAVVSNANGGGAPSAINDGWIQAGQEFPSGQQCTTAWFSTTAGAVTVAPSATITSAAWGCILVSWQPSPAYATGPGGTTGWSWNVPGFTGHGSAHITSSWSNDGSFALEVVSNGGGSSSSPWGVTSPFFPVVAGTTASMQVTVYTPTALSAVSIGFGWYNSSGGLLSTSAGDQGAVATTGGEIAIFTITGATVPQFATQAVFFVQEAAADANGVNFSIDTVQTAGGLIYSMSPVAGMDNYGNSYDQGIVFTGLPGLTNVLSVRDPYGNQLSVMDSSGNIAGQTVSAATDVLISGQSLNGQLNALPGGLINTGWIAASGGSYPNGTGVNAATIFLEVDQALEAGHAYRISCTSTKFHSSVTPSQCDLRIWYTTNGSTPSTSSTILAAANVPAPSGISVTSPPAIFGWYFASSAVTMRACAGIVPAAAGGSTPNVYLGTDAGPITLQLSYEDMGAINYTNNGILLDGSSGGTGHQTFTKTFYPSRSASWQFDGTSQGPGSMYQGTWGGAANSQAGYCDFSAVAAAIPTGATINYVQLRLTNLGTYYSSGMTVSLHVSTIWGRTEIDGEGGALSSEQKNWHIGRGQSLTTDVTSAGLLNTAGSGWLQSQTRYLVFTAPNNNKSKNYAGYFYGANANHNPNVPQLIVNYTY